MKWKPLIKAGGPLVTAAMLAGGGYEAAPVAAGGDEPTVIADLNWLTDPGILSMVGAPIENGFYVGTWPWATGGTATSALAIAAGADGGPVYDLTNGVGSDGTGNQALTLATPVVIPALATADWDIWIYCVMPAVGELRIGSSTANYPRITLSTDAGPTIADGSGSGAGDEVEVMTAGTKLVRFGNVAETLSVAWTGVADHAMNNEGYAAASSYDTLLAALFSNLYSATGAYLKALRIVTYPSGYADRASYRSTVETAISGAALT